MTHLFFDHQKRLWVSTNEYGVYIFDIEKHDFIKRISILKTNAPSRQSEIRALVEREPGEIVASTRAGVFIMNENGEVIQEIKGEQGQTMEKAVGAVRDRNGDIWILNNMGLHRFDKEGETKSFGKTNGIAGSADGSNFKMLKNGKIFIGKKNNTFHLFDPSALQINSEPPPIVFKNITVGGKELNFEKNINYLDGITLDYKRNFFTFSFAALNYSNPEKNKYAYKLEGLQDDWVMNENNNEAVFTNVPEGNYLLKIKAANNDGVWNEEGVSIKIKILPPWYRTWWAYLIYTGIIFSGIYFYWKFQRRRWQLQAQLQLEKEEAGRLKELDETKNQLYTNITHEFRTPLTVISGLAENIAGHEEEKKRILNNSQQMLHLVNQLLDLSKLQSGQLKYKAEPIDIIHYLNYLTDSFSSLANENNISLIFYSEIKGLEMDVDVNKLKTTLGNLIANAIKYTPEYGKALVTAHQINKNKLEIRITDSGIGIPPEKLPLIFDRFYQVDNSTTRKGEGTGIGLAIVKEFSKLMGGSVEVKSEVGKGSEFSIILPILQKTAKVNGLDIFQQKNRSVKNIGAEILPQEVNAIVNNTDADFFILLIEDNNDVAFYIESILRPLYKTEHARNGKLGVEAAFEKIPDLILCDVMMPEMDGFEVCETLKKDERTSHIPIILLTAKATHADKLSGLQFGADAYLTKPFDKEELLIRIEKLIERQQKLQAHYSSHSSLPSSLKVENSFLQKVWMAIEENYSDERFGLPQLCTTIYLERTQLYRKVKSLTGQSPSELIKGYRLQQAKSLLENSDLPVAQIAFDCGFGNASHFSKIFRDVYGATPTVFRK